MRRINFSSGDNTPSNDVVRLSVAMESDSKSSIYIQESGGKTLLTYATDSDYVFNLERFGRFSGEQRAISLDNSDNIGYDSGIAWVPGRRIATNSESLQIDEGLRAPLLSSENYFTDEEVEKNNTIVIEDYYDNSWVNGLDSITISNIKIVPDGNGTILGQGPFMEVVEPFIGNTGQIDIYSADLNSSVFSFEIRKDLKASVVNPNYSNPPKKKINKISYGNKSLEGFIEEWNSIFNITKNANINSRFRDGTIVDEHFLKELKSYMNDQWDGKMKRYLWDMGTFDSDVLLSSNDPERLRKIIFQQLKNYGASDDIKKMSDKYEMNLSWHIGVGGIDEVTKSKRYISRGLVYVPELNSFEFMSKVGGFAPRGAYFANSEANVAMKSDINNSSISNSVSNGTAATVNTSSNTDSSQTQGSTY